MARDVWDPQQLPDLTGRRYLVTGSNAGLGYFSCEQLVRGGARVVMTGRNPNRLSAARAALQRRVPGAEGRVESLILDTSNLGSVRAAAASAATSGPLHGVLLNAGIVHPPKTRQVTPDGVELVFATNTLGHFGLAGELLLPLAKTGGRIVWVGSVSTTLWPYDPADPQLVEGYSSWRAYVQSKVATTALGFEADRRLRGAGVQVASLVAHPGYSIGGRTPAVLGVNQPSRRKRFVDNLQGPVAQSKERGAWPLVRALTDPDAESGQFYGPRGVTRGAPRVVRASKITRDRDIAARLWDVCERTARVQWPLEKAARVRPT